MILVERGEKDLMAIRLVNGIYSGPDCRGAHRIGVCQVNVEVSEMNLPPLTDTNSSPALPALSCRTPLFLKKKSSVPLAHGLNIKYTSLCHRAQPPPSSL